MTKSSLPDWVEDIQDCDNNPCVKNGNQYRKALSIAWEALSSIENKSAIYAREAKDAMRRIEELGK